MEGPETPVPLAARIAKLAEPVPRRVIFKLQSDTPLNIKRVLHNFKQAVYRIYGEQNYKLLWFRCKDQSIVVALSGSRPVVAHVALFLTHGHLSGLFESGEILYEGMGDGAFNASIARQLRQYAATSVAHSFGGTHP